MATAAVKVLLLPEILANIIGNLTCLELTRIMHACSTWRDVIVADPKAQQIRFLRPAPIEKTSFITKLGIEIQAPIVTLCPFLFHVRLYHPNCESDILVFGSTCVLFNPMSLLQDPSDIGRDMFVSQPPCKVVDIKEQYYFKVPIISDDPEYSSKRTCECADGVRMGMLYDKFEKLGLDLDRPIEMNPPDVWVRGPVLAELPAGVQKHISDARIRDEETSWGEYGL